MWNNFNRLVLLAIIICNAANSSNFQKEEIKTNLSEVTYMDDLIAYNESSESILSSLSTREIECIISIKELISNFKFYQNLFTYNELKKLNEQTETTIEKSPKLSNIMLKTLSNSLNDLFITEKCSLENKVYNNIKKEKFDSKENGQEKSLVLYEANLKKFKTIISNILLYLPQNLARILANINSNQEKINKLINEMTNIEKIIVNFIEIIEIVFNKTNLDTESYTSLKELRFFDNCFGNILNDFFYQKYLFKKFEKLIKKEIDLENFFVYLDRDEFFLKLSMKGCDNYLKHIKELQ